MEQSRIFETTSDIGRSANLLGLALMAVSSAGAFITRRWLPTEKSHKNVKTTTDTTVIDMPKSQGI